MPSMKFLARMASEANTDTADRNWYLKRYQAKCEEYSGFIYLAHLESTPYYKIGLSKYPDRRMSEIARLPISIVITHKIETNNMFALEKIMHETYREKRVRGEWFELSQSDVANIRAFHKVTYDLGRH